MLAKNVEVSVVTSALAALLGSEGQTVCEEIVFGYSYREDGHCGDGAPRLNVRVTNGTNEATYAAAVLIPQLKVRSAVNGRPRTLDARPVLFLNGNPAVLLVDNEILSVVIVLERRDELRPGEAILDDNRVNDVVAGGREVRTPRSSGAALAGPC